MQRMKLHRVASSSAVSVFICLWKARPTDEKERCPRGVPAPPAAPPRGVPRGVLPGARPTPRGVAPPAGVVFAMLLIGAAGVPPEGVPMRPAARLRLAAEKGAPTGRPAAAASAAAGVAVLVGVAWSALEAASRAAVAAAAASARSSAARSAAVKIWARREHVEPRARAVRSAERESSFLPRKPSTS